MLGELRDHRRPRGGYPLPVWRVIELCAELLEDEGLPLEQGELSSFEELFVSSEQAVAAELEREQEEGDLVLQVPDRELRAQSVRELLTRVWDYARELGKLVDGEIVEHWDAIQPINARYRLLSLLTGGAVRNDNPRF